MPVFVGCRMALLTRRSSASAVAEPSLSVPPEEQTQTIAAGTGIDVDDSTVSYAGVETLDFEIYCDETAATVANDSNLSASTLNTNLGAGSYNNSIAGHLGAATLRFRVRRNGQVEWADEVVMSVFVYGVTVPTAQTVAWDDTLEISEGEGNEIEVTAQGSIELTLTVFNGTLSTNGTSGLTFSVGDGTNDATMTATATAANWNTALNGLIYTPDPTYAGSDTLTIASGATLGEVDISVVSETGLFNPVVKIGGVFEDTARTDAAVTGNAVKGITDASGNSYHLEQATTGSAPILSADVPTELSGDADQRSLDLDGANDWMEVPAALSNQTFANLTVEFWAKLDSTGTADYHGLCGMNQPFGRFLLFNNSGGDSLIENGNGALAGNGADFRNVWTHFVYVYNQTAGFEYIYQGGSQVGSQARSGDITGANTVLRIGDGFPAADPTYNFKGQLIPGKICMSAWSATQVAYRAAGGA